MKSNILRPVDRETALSAAFSETAIIDMLKELMRNFGIEPDLATVAQKELIAKKLAGVVGKAWGWHYVHNVLRGSIPPSKLFTAAILALGAQVDGTPALLSKARPMNLLVVGSVKPGSIVLVDSKECKNPYCKVSFIPKCRFQNYCSKECREMYDNMKKALKRGQIGQIQSSGGGGS